MSDGEIQAFVGLLVLIALVLAALAWRARKRARAGRLAHIPQPDAEQAAATPLTPFPPAPSPLGADPPPSIAAPPAPATPPASGLTTAPPATGMPHDQRHPTHQPRPFGLMGAALTGSAGPPELRPGDARPARASGLTGAREIDPGTYHPRPSGLHPGDPDHAEPAAPPVPGRDPAAPTGPNAGHTPVAPSGLAGLGAQQDNAPQRGHEPDATPDLNAPSGLTRPSEPHDDGHRQDAPGTGWGADSPAGPGGRNAGGAPPPDTPRAAGDPTAADHGWTIRSDTDVRPDPGDGWNARPQGDAPAHAGGGDADRQPGPAGRPRRTHAEPDAGSWTDAPDGAAPGSPAEQAAHSGERSGAHRHGARRFAEDAESGWAAKRWPTVEETPPSYVGAHSGASDGSGRDEAEQPRTTRFDHETERETSSRLRQPAYLEAAEPPDNGKHRAAESPPDWPPRRQ